jgi:TolB protein
VSVADGALTQLTQPPGTQTNPFYSPDGRQIAFHSDREGRVEVWVMNADGSGQRRLTSAGTGGHFVRWTKDGRGILMASAGRTLRLDVATGATTELPHVSSGAHMSFSPDQSRVLDARTHRTLWVHPMDGSEPYEVYDVAEPDMRIDYPVWSPDGKWILFDHASPRGGRYLAAGAARPMSMLTAVVVLGHLVGGASATHGDTAGVIHPAQDRQPERP